MFLLYAENAEKAIWYVFAYCTRNPKEFIVIDTPAEIAERAFEFARLYAESNTLYGYGKQEPVRNVIQIDCSGLVVMCYKYALVDTPYQLPVPDMTANYMYENASTLISIHELRKGDLLFMGESDSSEVTHIALFEKEEDGKIYFIDSTQKDTDNDGVFEINGVTQRHYEADDSRFKAFGKARLIAACI